MTITNSELESIQHLDFIQHIPCDHNQYKNKADCTEQAVTSFLLHCCGEVYFRCEEHGASNRAWLARCAKNNEKFKHATSCGAEITVDDVTERPL